MGILNYILEQFEEDRKNRSSNKIGRKTKN